MPPVAIMVSNHILGATEYGNVQCPKLLITLCRSEFTEPSNERLSTISSLGFSLANLARVGDGNVQQDVSVERAMPYSPISLRVFPCPNIQEPASSLQLIINGIVLTLSPHRLAKLHRVGARIVRSRDYELPERQEPFCCWEIIIHLL